MTSMTGKSEKFQNLPQEVRTLIADGVYSLYKVTGKHEFVLITDTREIYLLDEEGTITQQLKSTDGLEFDQVINLPRTPDFRTLKINYA